MIEFEEKDDRLVKREFDKGNNLWLVIEKKQGKFIKQGKFKGKELNLINWMKYEDGRLRMACYSYYLDGEQMEGEKRDGGFELEINSWNFLDYRFYILTKEEAKPYLKKIMIAKILGKEKG